MSLLHLELDIDSQVHPELYDRLASLERVAAREERLRQLAATGLIWEIARLHAPASAAPDSAQQPVGEQPPRGGAVQAQSPDPGPVDAGTVDDHPVRIPADVPMLTDIVTEVEARVDIEAPVQPDVVLLRDTRRSGKASSARLKRMKDLGLFQNG